MPEPTFKPYQQIRLTEGEISLLRDALGSYEREWQKTRHDFFRDWNVRTRCEREIDKARHLSRVLDSCVPHD